MAEEDLKEYEDYQNGTTQANTQKANEEVMKQRDEELNNGK